MTATDIFIIVWLAVIAVYDIWCCCNRRANDTISHRVTFWSRRYPLLGLVLVVFMVLLLGHFFLNDSVRWIWPQPVFMGE